MGLSPRIDTLSATDNKAINGHFEFWQRGTSVSVSNAANTYLADRFSFRPAGLTATATMARSTDVPTQAQAGYKLNYSVGLTTTNQVASPGSSAVASLAYRMEGYDYSVLHASNARFQFWVKTSVTGIYSLTLSNSPVSRQYVSSFVVSAANTWELKTFDIALDTGAGWTFDNSLALDVRVNLQIGSGGQTSTLNAWQSTSSANIGASGHANLWAGTAGATFFMTGFAIYPGSYTSAYTFPFKPAAKTIQQELAMCQRYFEKSWAVNTPVGTATADGFTYKNYMSAQPNAQKLYIVTQEFRVMKRIAPTASQVGFWDNTGVGGYGVTTNAKIEVNIVVTPTTFTGSTESNITVRVDDTASTTQVTTRYHWAVDTEL